MPDNTIQETGNRKEATRWTRQRTSHEVNKELGRGSRDQRRYPSQESEGHTESQTKKHPKSPTKATKQQKRLRQRKRKNKLVRLSKTLKTSR